MRRLFSLLFYHGWVFILTFLISQTSQVLAAEFELVGSHPGARSQPTTLGRKLHGALVYQNKIYWGYGDFEANTGPIEAIPFDPVTLTFLPSEASLRTEAIYNFRIFSNGKLYVPHIDPHLNLVDMAYSRRDTARWVQTQVPMYHIFDVLELNNQVYLVGANGSGAVIYQSNSNETGFQRILVQTPGNLSTVRFYFGFVWADKLYVQAADRGLGQRFPTSKVYDGQQWTDGPDLLPQGGYGSYSNHFAGRVIYKSKGGSNVGLLYAFDGTSAYKVRSNVRDYAINDENLYILQNDGAILSTVDLTHWEVVSQSGIPSPTSIAIAEDRIFIGTANSNIYRSSFSLLTDPGPGISLSLENNSPTILGQATTLVAQITGGSVTGLEWDFGDSSPILITTTTVVSHTYPNTGTYTAWLTATNTVNTVYTSTLISIIAISEEPTEEPPVQPTPTPPKPNLLFLPLIFKQ